MMPVMVRSKWSIYARRMFSVPIMVCILGRCFVGVMEFASNNCAIFRGRDPQVDRSIGISSSELHAHMTLVWNPLFSENYLIRSCLLRLPHHPLSDNCAT